MVYLIDLKDTNVVNVHLPWEAEPSPSNWKSRRDRMCAKLREIKEGLRQRMHRPIPETGKWLAQIVAGYFAYHAVPTNSPALSAFRYHVLVLWHRQLCRRSQRARVLWTRMTKLADEFLPPPRVLHPWPSVRFAVRHPR